MAPKCGDCGKAADKDPATSCPTCWHAWTEHAFEQVIPLGRPVKMTCSPKVHSVDYRSLEEALAGEREGEESEC